MYLTASFYERKKYINVHSEDFTSYLLWISPVWHKMWIVIEGLLSLWVRWPTPVVEAPSKAVYSSVGTESIVLCSLGIDLSANDFSTARHLGETVAVQCCNWICCIVCLPIRTDWCSCLHGAHLGPVLRTVCARKKHIQTSLHTLLSGDRVHLGCLTSWRAFWARTRKILGVEDANRLFSVRNVIHQIRTWLFFFKLLFSLLERQVSPLHKTRATCRTTDDDKRLQTRQTDSLNCHKPFSSWRCWPAGDDNSPSVLIEQSGKKTKKTTTTKKKTLHHHFLSLLIHFTSLIYAPSF